MGFGSNRCEPRQKQREACTVKGGLLLGAEGGKGCHMKLTIWIIVKAVVVSIVPRSSIY